MRTTTYRVACVVQYGVVCSSSLRQAAQKGTFKQEARISQKKEKSLFWWETERCLCVFRYWQKKKKKRRRLRKLGNCGSETERGELAKDPFSS